MFMKDQFRLLKNSSSEQNICESVENRKVIEFFNSKTKT